MLITSPAKPPRSRRARKAPANLTLVAASAFQPSSTVLLTLTFDRAIDVTTIDLTQITVNYPANLLVYRGYAVTSVNGKAVTMSLTSFGPNTGPTMQLTATANTRIVAGDGGMWPGWTNLALPLV